MGCVCDCLSPDRPWVSFRHHNAPEVNASSVPAVRMWLRITARDPCRKCAMMSRSCTLAWARVVMQPARRLCGVMRAGASPR